MSIETKWIPWNPQVGDMRPERYRVREKGTDYSWTDSPFPLTKIMFDDIELADYQIPAPEEQVMKHWQPRREPVVSGWTLADVPERVRCDIDMNHGSKLVAHVQNGRVYANGNMLDHEPAYYKVLRVLDPIPPGQLTLDKVPEGVNCVVSDCDDKRTYVARHERGDVLFGRGDDTSGEDVSSCVVLHILDPLPQVSYTLETLPVGRVIECDGKCVFKAGDGSWNWWKENGYIKYIMSMSSDSQFTVTDYIMELREVSNAI